MEQRIRVLVAKPGLDGHDRGALVVAQALRDEGMEVVYTGLRQTPAQIAAAAIQEDVDCVGLSCLSGAHNELFPEVVRLLREQGADDILVVGGGVIPQEDIPYLKEHGVAEVFTPGTPTSVTADFIRAHVKRKQLTFQKAPKKIAHIGIAVKNLDKALPFYTEQLGLNLLGTEAVESEQVRVAFLGGGESRIELLEPMSADSPIAKFIDKRGEGIHHIAFDVENVAERLHHLQANGIPLINEVPKPGAHGAQIAFIHPKAAGGVLFELCEYPDTSAGKEEGNDE
ncbi:methylmalonyl-CoA epimerase [Brevibacillus borstelensis]|uniref:methylmalonyl-CoA epimerase n=1 Tax=Brevibacillus borstelensis TaxID=45462 RepID=UPI002E2176D0|nr:methylmalonyl-CoA epimerase [Brevibacillus borstelensis]MED2010896.1 methylmalonyl-CoA epimerase [Brevibacillus borstelensis]